MFGVCERLHNLADCGRSLYVYYGWPSRILRCFMPKMTVTVNALDFEI